jgi:hypothetical protein
MLALSDDQLAGVGRTKPMRKLLLNSLVATAALLVASIATPSAAQDTQEMAEGISTMVQYDLNCGGLPPKTKAFAIKLAGEWQDKMSASFATLSILQEMQKFGTAAWCETSRPNITALESRLAR